MIIFLTVIATCSVDDHTAAILDVLEGLERLVQVADELGQFVSSGLADVAFVDYEHDLDLLVDVEQSLDEEGVRDLVLLALVVLEAGAVVEGHALDDNLGGDGGLGVLLVADLDARLLRGVENGLESVETHHELGARQEGHDGALADSSIADHDDGLGVLLVDWNRLDTSVDEGLQFVQVNRVALFVHIWCRFDI